jgi:hypothetical protein
MSVTRAVGNSRRHRYALLVVGSLLGIITNLAYFLSGYQPYQGWLWLAAIVVLALHFGRHEAGRILPDGGWNKDLVLGSGLILLSAPFYLLNLYNVPFQINSDEIVVMDLIIKNSQPPINVFGVGGHFDTYALVFTVFGWVTQALGEIDFLHVRLTHALLGLLTIAASYAFFRLFFFRPYAFGAAMLLGFNHALLAISRMAMRENSALLIELLALTLLYVGFRRTSSFYSFLGGAFAGLAFYVYAPARVVLIVWPVFLALVVLVQGRVHLSTRWRQCGAAPLLGFTLVMVPWFITAYQAPPGTFAYGRQQFVIYPEGAQLQRQWNGAATTTEALLLNARNGLTMFNRPLHDHGYIYPNRGHGFVDPLTGMLLWIGALNVVWHIFTQPKRTDNLLVAGGFFGVWLFMALITTKNPNYTRLLVLLPFIAWFTLTGLHAVVSGFMYYVGRFFELPAKRAVTLVVSMGVVGMSFWNLTILSDFVAEGLTQGNDLGGTARYVMARSEEPAHAFYLAADTAQPYFSWNEPAWQHWVAAFAQQNQSVSVISPDTLAQQHLQAPFSVLTRADVWAAHRDDFSRRFPTATIHAITPDGRLLAIEMTGSLAR